MHDNTSLRDGLGGLGQVVREVREQRCLSERDLAAATGVAIDDVRALEAGNLDPGYEMLVALADGLGVKLSSLIIQAEALS